MRTLAELLAFDVPVSVPYAAPTALLADADPQTKPTNWTAREVRMRPMFVLGAGLALACLASSALAAMSVSRLEVYGFASLDGWHVGSCTLPLKRTFACTHLAKENLRAKASEAGGELPYVPMALTCPESGSGVLGLISTNGLGYIELLAVVYDAHVPRQASVGTAVDVGSDIKQIFSYRVGPETQTSDTDEATKARRILERSELLKTKVCDASE